MLRTKKERITGTQSNTSIEGFTLLEMSMVAIVISVFVSIVLVGQDLVHTSKLQAVVTEVQELQSTITAFELNYNGLPGDMTNASDFWPACVDDPNNTSNTCNGNGDGKIESALDEGLRVWQHLGLSGVISQKYTGILDPSYTGSISVSDNNDWSLIGTAHAGQPKTTICHVTGSSSNPFLTITVAKPSFLNAHLLHGDSIGSCEGSGGEEEVAPPVVNIGKFTVGVNVPESSFDGAGYKVNWNNGLQIGFATESVPLLSGSALTPQDAWRIDNKIDDGMASSGTTLTSDGEGATGCVTTTGTGYDVDDDNSLKCQLFFSLS